MGSDLLAGLVSKPQREVAGADSSSRFSYQRNWAFVEMLRKHIGGEDFLVAFEYHDDVVFFDSCNSPSAAEFCQVKTSQSTTSPKRLSTLTSRSKVKGSETEKKNSVIGKMILNLDGICQDFSIRLLLISNTYFDFATETICAENLDEKYKTKLIEKISEEFPERDAEDLLKLIDFVVTEIPLSSMDTYIRGATVDLFTSKFGDGFQYNVNSWIRLIQGEITRKNDFASADIKSVSELIEKKCLSSDFIDQSLEKISQLHSNAPDLQIIKIELKSEGWSAVNLLKLDKAIAIAAKDYVDPSNTECRVLCETISSILDGQDADLSIGGIIEQTFGSLQERASIPSVYDDKYTISALTILVLNESL
ncbi:dsDNA nuclease domain-containing protein [Kordiimonas sp.]|uniref:dsDNA nuclease domain-containing protein n=1 Tax=Kordiimonas sp. TaxID=1970157 RepID=UPI003A924068